MVFVFYKFSTKSIKNIGFRNIAKKKVRGTKSVENDFRFWRKVLSELKFLNRTYCCGIGNGGDERLTWGSTRGRGRVKGMARLSLWADS